MLSSLSNLALSNFNGLNLASFLPPGGGPPPSLADSQGARLLLTATSSIAKSGSSISSGPTTTSASAPTSSGGPCNAYGAMAIPGSVNGVYHHAPPPMPSRERPKGGRSRPGTSSASSRPLSPASLLSSRAGRPMESCVHRYFEYISEGNCCICKAVDDNSSAAGNSGNSSTGQGQTGPDGGPSVGGGSLCGRVIPGKVTSNLKEHLRRHHHATYLEVQQIDDANRIRRGDRPPKSVLNGLAKLDKMAAASSSSHMSPPFSSSPYATAFSSFQTAAATLNGGTPGGVPHGMNPAAAAFNFSTNFLQQQANGPATGGPNYGAMGIPGVNGARTGHLYPASPDESHDGSASDDSGNRKTHHRGSDGGADSIGSHTNSEGSSTSSGGHGPLSPHLDIVGGGSVESGYLAALREASKGCGSIFDVPDPAVFWGSVAQLGLFPEIARDLLIEVGQMLNPNHPVERIQSAGEKLSGLVKVLGLQDRLYETLRARCSFALAQTESLATEVQALKQRAEEKERRQREIKRKSEVLGNLIGGIASNPGDANNNHSNNSYSPLNKKQCLQGTDNKISNSISNILSRNILTNGSLENAQHLLAIAAEQRRNSTPMGGMGNNSNNNSLQPRNRLGSTPAATPSATTNSSGELDLSGFVANKVEVDMKVSPMHNNSNERKMSGSSNTNNDSNNNIINYNNNDAATIKQLSTECFGFLSPSNSPNVAPPTTPLPPLSSINHAMNNPLGFLGRLAASHHQQQTATSASAPTPPVAPLSASATSAFTSVFNRAQQQQQLSNDFVGSPPILSQNNIATSDSVTPGLFSHLENLSSQASAAAASPASATTAFSTMATTAATAGTSATATATPPPPDMTTATMIQMDAFSTMLARIQQQQQQTGTSASSMATAAAALMQQSLQQCQQQQLQQQHLQQQQQFRMSPSDDSDDMHQPLGLVKNSGGDVRSSVVPKQEAVTSSDEENLDQNEQLQVTAAVVPVECADNEPNSATDVVQQPQQYTDNVALPDAAATPPSQQIPQLSADEDAEDLSSN